MDDGAPAPWEGIPTIATIPTTTNNNTNTNDAIAAWRERERRQRTVRLLMMFLLMLLLMDGEEQSQRKRKDKLLGAKAARKAAAAQAKYGLFDSDDGQFVYNARRQQEEKLQHYAQKHERYAALVEMNYGLNVELEVRKWAKAVEDIRLKGDGVSGRNDDGNPDLESSSHQGDTENDGMSNEKAHEASTSRTAEDPMTVFHYPWNATGFYRGEWIRESAPVRSTEEDGDEEGEIVLRSVETKKWQYLTPIQMEGRMEDMRKERMISGQMAESVGVMLLPNHVCLKPENKTDQDMVRASHRRKKGRRRRSANSGLFSSWRMGTPELNEIIDNAEDEDEDEDLDDMLPPPEVTLKKSKGRAAFQLYSRAVPAMKELSLVDGFIKLYDSSTVGYSTRYDILLRVKGILIHSIGRLSLVSNADHGRSAFMMMLPKEDEKETTTTKKKTKPKESKTLPSASVDTEHPATAMNMTAAEAITMNDDDSNSRKEDDDDSKSTEMAGEADRRHRKLLEAIMEEEQPNQATIEELRNNVMNDYHIDALEDDLAGWDTMASATLDDNGHVMVEGGDEENDRFFDHDPMDLFRQEERMEQMLGRFFTMSNGADEDEDEDDHNNNSNDVDQVVEGRERRRLQDEQSYSESVNEREAEKSETADEPDSSLEMDSSMLDEDIYETIPLLETEMNSADFENASVILNRMANLRQQRMRQQHRTLETKPMVPPEKTETFRRTESKYVFPFPYVTDDLFSTLGKQKTTVSRKMPPHEQMLEENARRCEFELNLNVHEVEWTVGEWRTLMSHREHEARRVDPKLRKVQTHKQDESSSTESNSKQRTSKPRGVDSSELKQVQDQAWVVTLTGNIVSPNCAFNASLNTTAIRTDWQHTTGKAINYSFYMMITCLTQIVVLLRQLLHTQAQSTAMRVSLLCIGWQTILDALLCLGHIYLSLAMQPLFTAFASVAFFKLLIFCVIEMKYMAIIIQARNSSNGGQTTTEVLRRQVALLHLRFYVALPAAFLALYYTPGKSQTLAVLVMYSFWVPQIIQNIITEAKHPLHNYYILGMSLTRLVAPLYMFGVPNNFLKEVYPEAPTNFLLCELLLVWVAIQAIILDLQGRYGARFMIPARFLPPKFNYHRPIPESLLSPEMIQQLRKRQEEPQSRSSSPSSPSSSSPLSLVPPAEDSTPSNRKSAGTTRNRIKGNRRKKEKATMTTEDVSATESRGPMMDCVICCNGIDITNRRGYMLTPCNHVFHKDCLLSWMDVKMECPVCRKELPAL